MTPKLKKLELHHDAEGRLVCTVNRVPTFFTSFEKALDFHRTEYECFEKEGYAGCISVIAFGGGGLNKTEKRRAMGRYYKDYAKS